MVSGLVKPFLGLALLTGLGLTQVGGLAGETLRDCGNEGERQCIALLGQVDQYNNACDSALAPKLEWSSCACLLKGPFGGCLLRLPCYKCRNGTRHRTDTTELYRTSWVRWAL